MEGVQVAPVIPLGPAVGGQMVTRQSRPGPTRGGPHVSIRKVVVGFGDVIPTSRIGVYHVERAKSTRNGTGREGHRAMVRTMARSPCGHRAIWKKTIPSTLLSLMAATSALSASIIALGGTTAFLAKRVTPLPTNRHAPMALILHQLGRSPPWRSPQ